MEWRSDSLGVLPRVWTVGALLLAISDALNARFAAVTVRGEISGFTRASSGHCYFTLKDAQGSAGMRCAMFRRAAQLLDFAPRDGQQVELRGRLAVYEARGELQMVAEAMQRIGSGQLYEEFLRLKTRLEAEGWFDPARKRPLPPHPRRLAVVTSTSGAALHDVLTTLARRAPHVEVVVCPTLVQGADAPAAIGHALEAARRCPGVELVLLCRGGGSLEDLWAFNDERVVRAIAAPGPALICGVGHETDVTLADLAADLRAPTPTGAAELASPAQADLLTDLQNRQRSLTRWAQRRLDMAHQNLDHLALRLRQPAHRLALEIRRLETLAQRQRLAVDQVLSQIRRQHTQSQQRWLHALRATVGQQQQRLNLLAVHLDAANPRQVLRRGYAWVESAQGRPVVSAQQVEPGSVIRAVWADGDAQAQVLTRSCASPGSTSE